MGDSLKQQEELQAAEDLRRQLQERSLSIYSRPSVADRFQWLRDNKELLDRIQRTSWGSAPGTGLSPTQFMEELAAVPLPSPHDESLTYAIVRMLSMQIEDACRQLSIPLHSGVAYGSNATLDIGSPFQHGVPLTDASVISLGVGFITFCSSLSRMFSLSFPHEPDGNRLRISFAPDLVLAKIESNENLKNYWEKVFREYAIGSGSFSGCNETVPYPASHTRAQLLFAMERFSLAHEYGHHIGQHGRRMVVAAGSDQNSFAQEFEADLFALNLERYIGMQDVQPNLFSASGAAAVILLKCHDCIKYVRRILTTGQDTLESDGVHPATADRIAAFDTLDHQFSEPQASNLRELRLDCAKIIDKMYIRLKPRFIALHEQGVRPLPSITRREFDPPHYLL
jgi:hypothetical protein